MGMDRIGADALFDRLAAKRDDLVALTQELVRIPTVNPPGENYRDICELLARRLERSGFAATIERAAGAPGDSDRHPRWNVVAQREDVFNTDCPTAERLAAASGVAIEEILVRCPEPSADELRYSAGLSVTWLTGMGPMTFALAIPFNSAPWDEEERFSFELGRTF